VCPFALLTTPERGIYALGNSETPSNTDLIRKGAPIKSFALFAQPPAAWEKAWNTIVRCFSPAESSQYWLRRSR